MYSTYTNYDYPIDVFVPHEPAPAEGFPVLVVLDGHRYTNMFFEAMQNQLRIRQKTNVIAHILVSVGHQQDDTTNRRFYDFTAPAAAYHFPLRHGRQMKAVRAGGAVDFQQFLAHELLPMIHAQYDTNPQKVSLFGHSLGGLFSLWCYLTKPQLFQQYVAVSPSIWWNQHELLQRLRETKTYISTPLAIYVGGHEGDMVDDALIFYKHRHAAQPHVEFYVALEENHASVIPTTMSKMLRFISRH